jgi:hypothetical protein
MHPKPYRNARKQSGQCLYTTGNGKRAFALCLTAQ